MLFVIFLKSIEIFPRFFHLKLKITTFMGYKTNQKHVAQQIFFITHLYYLISICNKRKFTHSRKFAVNMMKLFSYFQFFVHSLMYHFSLRLAVLLFYPVILSALLFIKYCEKISIKERVPKHCVIVYIVLSVNLLCTLVFICNVILNQT